MAEFCDCYERSHAYARVCVSQIGCIMHSTRHGTPAALMQISVKGSIKGKAGHSSVPVQPKVFHSIY